MTGDRWIAADAQGGWYTAVFNLGDTDSTVSIEFTDLEIYDAVEGTELWSGEQNRKILRRT